MDSSPLLPKDCTLPKSPPVDKGSLIWICSLILGTGVLAAWNTFITAYDYFSALYGDDIEFKLSCAFSYPSILVLFFNVKFGNRFSLDSRIISCSILNLLVMVATPIVGLDQWTMPNENRLILLLGMVFAAGCANGVLFGAVVGLVAAFPPDYTTAVMSGIGLSGIVSAVLRIVTKASVSNTQAGMDLSSVLYFGITAFNILITIVCFYVIKRSAFSKYYLDASMVQSVPINERSGPDTVQSERTHIGVVFFKIINEALAVFLTFFTTLSLYPGVTSQITPNNGMLPNGWYQVLLLSTFALFDFVGRSLPRLVTIVSAKLLILPVLMRLVFFPLFVLCVSPKLIAWEGAPFIIMVFCALSNGYFGTLAMVFAPQKVDNHEKETAGAMMGLFLNLGVTGGVNAALLIAKLV